MEMLGLRLDELQALTAPIGRQAAQGRLEKLPELIAEAAALELVYDRLDGLAAYVAAVGAQLAVAEAEVAAAELREFGPQHAGPAAVLDALLGLQPVAWDGQPLAAATAAAAPAAAAGAAPAAVQAPSAGLAPHPGYSCDTCGTGPICGLRHSLPASDFDLCQGDWRHTPRRQVTLTKSICLEHAPGW